MFNIGDKIGFILNMEDTYNTYPFSIKTVSLKNIKNIIEEFEIYNNDLLPKNIIILGDVSSISKTSYEIKNIHFLADHSAYILKKVLSEHDKTNNFKVDSTYKVIAFKGPIKKAYKKEILTKKYDELKSANEFAITQAEIKMQEINKLVTDVQNLLNANKINNILSVYRTNKQLFYSGASIIEKLGWDPSTQRC